VDSGPAAIQRALFGRIGVTPLAGAFFAYNANFTWGFFNYYFATGLCFLMFAAWIATAKKRGPAALAGFALAIGALYACHLAAVFLLLVMIACFEASLAWAERDFDLKRLFFAPCRSVLSFCPPPPYSCSSSPRAPMAGNSPSISPTRSATVSRRRSNSITTIRPIF